MNEEPVHLWHHCHHCNQGPIKGRRYHCEACPDGPDNDLCEPCYERYQKGEIPHPLENSPAIGLGIEEHRFVCLEGKPAGQYDDWLRVGHPEAADPSIAGSFVVRPLFSCGLDSVMGSYAFVVTVNVEGGSGPLLLTALHVMDEIIKKKGIDTTDANPGYTGKELPAIITEVNLYDVFAPNWMTAPLGTAGPMLVLPEARTGDEEPYSHRDIAAFRVSDSQKLKPAPLAVRVPQKGEPVWGVVKLAEKPGQRLLKAVVVDITPRSLVFKFEQPDEAGQARYPSGSPLLNRQGEVVGIRIGGGTFGHQKFGHANHVGNIRRHLSGVIQ